MRTLSPVGPALLFSLLFALVPLAAQAQAPNAWINELHYDNTGSDTGEFVEVVVQNPGAFDLGDLEVRLYRDDGTRYGSIGDVAGDFTEGNTSGAFTVYSWEPGSIQNGPANGLALCYDDTAIQVLSYEGTFTGTEGDCADGIESTDIGVDEDPAPPPGHSLQLTGAGAAYAGFAWSGPDPESPGEINDGQSFLSSPIVVDTDGTEDFTSLQSALDAAGHGYTIDVQPGTYSEDIAVNVPSTVLEGPNAGNPGDGSRGSEATIEGQVVISASDVVFDGFDVAPPAFGNNTSEGEAVRVSNAPDGVTVTNTVVRDFEDGSGATGSFDATAINAFGGVADDPIETVTITDNKVARVARDGGGAGAVGISIQGNVDGATVTGNVIQDVGQARSAYALGIAVRSTDNHSVDPTGVSVMGNEISDIRPDPQSDFDGVGFEFEPENAANPVTVTDNTFANTTVQIEDKTLGFSAGLDLSALLADNTFDRAVVVRNANGGVKDESGVQKVYSPISPAVTAAAPGETVEVRGGTYAETVTVDKALTLQDASTPIVDAFEVAADNVTIEGFEITGGTVGGETAGIVVQSSTSGHTFSANTLNGPGDGTGLRVRSGARDTEITENNISDWTLGVDASAPGQNVQVTGNCITGNATAGVQSSGGQILTAAGNYWGAASGPSGDYPGTGDAAVGPVTVDFSPEPVAACPSGDPTPACTATTLSESVTPPEDGDPGVVTATFTNTDGLEEIEYTKLDNFTVTSEPSGFTRSGDTWTADDLQNPPTTAVFDLTQTTVGDPSTYFAIAASTCPTEEDDRLEVNFDPVHELPPEAPATLQFAGNAPNPFGDRTTIEFALPEPTDVTLTVYDMMGRRVATLVDGPARAGTHQIPWAGGTRDGQALASGVYLLRLTAGDQAFTERMTLVR